MGYFLGIDVGATRTVAAVARAGADGVETVALEEGAAPDAGDTDTDRADTDGIAAVLHLGADGVLAVGAAAQEWARHEPDRVVAGFPGRIGEDAMLLAGEPWAPEELTAWLVRWVVDRVAQREGDPAVAVAVSHPASWDADRVRLLADAVAEQDLEVAFLAAAGDGAAVGHGDPAGDDRGAGARAARAAAGALRAAATVTAGSLLPGPLRHGPLPTGPVPVDASGSGRHAAVSRGTTGTGATTAVTEGSGRHVAAGVTGPAPDGTATRDVAGETDTDTADEPAGIVAPVAPVADTVPDDPAGDRTAADDPDPERPAEGDRAGHDRAGDDADPADRDEPDPNEPAGEDRGGDAGPDPGWDVPAPRSPYPADPATANLVADLVGFTGGMGATNTAGLLSGYTPPHGMPGLWSGAAAAGTTTAGTTTAETTTAGTTTATDSAVALPAQRAESGRWAAVAPEGHDGPSLAPEAPVAVTSARQNPTVLVSAGGLAAAAAVVATLFLWPAPRITNSAARPVAAVPAATTTAQPDAPTVALTPTAEPTPVHHSRPPAPRPRRPVVPVVSLPESATESTEPPTDSTDPTAPRTTAPSSTSSSTTPTTTTTTKAHNN